MYPIDFSEGRRNKKKKKSFQIPELPAYTWAVVSGAIFLLVVVVAGFDYAAVSRAETVIEEMEVTMAGRGSSKQIQAVAGVSPERKTRSNELHETYTFSRVLPFPAPAATVVYSSSGQITRIVRE